MSLFRCAGGIGEEDLRVFRLYKLCTCEARLALHLVFQWGCRRDPTKSLREYLEKDRGMKPSHFRVYFNQDMRRMIDDDPSGDGFDVSLLFNCVQTACGGLAAKGEAWREGDDARLESVCTSIKNFRNRLVHDSRVGDDAEMLRKARRLGDLLERAISLAGALYGRPPSEVDARIREMRRGVDGIMAAPASPPDVEAYLQEVRRLREGQRELVRKEGPAELAQKYAGMTRVDPASFVTGKERLQVRSVFTRLEVVAEEDGANVCHPIDYEDLVALGRGGDDEDEEEAPPVVVTVVEGDAGAGKTTLVKLLLDDWSSAKTSGSPSAFRGLDAYDLVLCAEARNRSVDSLLALLWVLMPRLRGDLDDDVLLRSVLDLDVLLVVDGLDELNDASARLMADVFDRHLPASDGGMKVLVTTRPNALHDLPRIVRLRARVHTRLRGIAPDARAEYVQRLHEEMRKESLSGGDTRSLVDYLKQSHSRLGEHYRLPLNLTLLTYLWADDPGRVNQVTTATDLYVAFLELKEKRLVDRLASAPSGGVATCRDLPRACREFLPDLYHVCLETLSSGGVQLAPESIRRLEDRCRRLGLPPHEMCASFLVLEKEWTPSGYVFDYYVPHKSIMEFYAASRVFSAVAADPKDSAEDSLLEDIPEEKRERILKILREEEDRRPRELLDVLKSLLSGAFRPEELFAYQNMLLHLGGLLAYGRPDVLEEYAKQLVDLLKLSKVEGTQWLDLVVETKCNDAVAELVAQKVTKQLVVRDGHTRAALKLFTFLPSNIPVQIILENEVHSIPHLDELLEEISERSCSVEILLKHQWKHSQYGRSDDLLKKIESHDGEQKCRLVRFWGYLGSFAVLPVTVTSLHFNIVDNSHAKAITSELAMLTRNLSIETLGVHVMRGVSTKYLKELPMVKPVRKECGSLWVSDMGDDVEWAIHVCRALLPEEGRYHNLMFPRSNLSLPKCEELLKRLREEGIKIIKRGSLKFSSDTINKSQMVDIRYMAREALDADLCNVTCCEEAGMW